MKKFHQLINLLQDLRSSRHKDGRIYVVLDTLDECSRYEGGRLPISLYGDVKGKKWKEGVVSEKLCLDVLTEAEIKLTFLDFEKKTRKLINSIIEEKIDKCQSTLDLANLAKQVEKLNSNGNENFRF